MNSPAASCGEIHRGELGFFCDTRLNHGAYDYSSPNYESFSFWNSPKGGNAVDYAWGTFCQPCVEDTEAMPFVREHFLKQ